jgi:DNA phosphorothioation-dependent restriction protein DptG
MESIISIENLNAEIGDNIPSEYLPVKTNYNECNWDVVAGYFIGFAYGLELKKYSKQEFETDCKQAFLTHQISEKHFGVIHKAFFENENYLKLGPTNLLLHTQNDDPAKVKVNSASKKVASSLLTLLGRFNEELSNKESDHFISELITTTLKKKLNTKLYNDQALTYLPYLQEKFVHDFRFLASKPSYMLENIASFLSIYSFLYTAQIALNLKEWRQGAPTSRPLFFVIETEKVSAERTKVIESGWKSFAQASQNLFPMLSTLQLIQAKTARKPLWQIYHELQQLDNAQQQECIETIDSYCERFVSARNLRKSSVKTDSLENTFEQLLDLAFAQFDKNYADPTTTRYQANEKLVAALKENTAKGFVKAKGRIGNILVLTQDHLLLLTNVIIGEEKQLRFNELLDELKLRGIFFDETSEERLIEFYERIGNVERMSDSGDDLYVRQTA